MITITISISTKVNPFLFVFENIFVSIKDKKSVIYWCKDNKW
jgi:hypothetical protein